MNGTGHARELVEAEKLSHPGAVELATFVSLAVHIESELLRAMRIAVAPGLDAAAEADLWFGPLVRLRGPDGITLDPDIAEILRDCLKRRWQDRKQRDLVKRAWLVTQRTHQDTSPALVLEEQVAWYVLIGDMRSAEAELDRAVKALATDARPGVTGWFSQAWGRMPPEARDTRAGWLLHHASGRPGPVRIQPTTIPDGLLSHDLDLALSAVGDVELGVRRDGDLVELGDISAHQAAAILVPDTDPRIVEIRWPDQPARRAEVVPVPSGQLVGWAVGGGRLQLRTARGVLYELATQPVRRYFIAAGTANYRDMPPVPGITRDIARMTELFTQLGYEHVLPELSSDPTRVQLMGRLEQWVTDPSRRASDMVALLLAGHGGLDHEQLYLYTADSSPDNPAATAVAAAQLGRILANGTVGPVLVILDTAYAQRGVEELARESGHRDLCAISSAGRNQAAVEGAFVDAFLEAFEDETFGPQAEYLAPDALVSVINQHLTASGHTQQAGFLGYNLTGLRPFLPNPRYNPAIPTDIDLGTQRGLLRTELRDHWAPRARGVQTAAEPGWYFTGRTQVLKELVAFIAATEPQGEPWPRVVTGAPGSGKSAVLARLVTLSDPDLRAATPLAGIAHDTVPPAGIIDAAISAGRRTLVGLWAALGTALGLPDVAEPADVLAAITARNAPFIVVLDALDEAAEPRQITRELLRPLAAIPHVRLIVGTRRILLDEIGPDAVVIDLDSPRYLSPADLSAYAQRILLADDDRTGATPYQGRPELAVVARALAERASPSFLVVQLAARALAAQPAPVDVTSADWQERLPTTVAAAFDYDLVRLGGSERHARSLLTPLAYAEGAGLPREGGIWAAMATALAGEPMTDADITWLLEQVGGYITQGTEHGLPAYRLWHEALVGHLRRQADERQAQRQITQALVTLVPLEPDGTPNWQAAPPYIRSHLATHAAAAGMLTTLLEDPEYVRAADPGRLREAQERMTKTAPTARQSSRSGGKLAGALIVAVHGMGQQLATPAVLHAQWLPALEDGMEIAGADPITGEDLAVAFYGDLFREIAGTGKTEKPDDEVGQGLEGEMAESLWRAAKADGRAPEPEAAPGAGRWGVVQRALRALSESRFFAGLSERVIAGDFRQLGRYLTEPTLRQAARARVADAIGPGTRVVIAHSIGSIVAYETLCAHPEWNVRMFITLGSPLGLRNLVFDRLDPPPQDGIGSWPGSIQRWVNLADEDDIVALEKRLRPVFAGPIDDVLVDNGAQAHDVTRYLSSIEAGRAIAAGLAE